MLDLPRRFNLNRRERERQFSLPAVELKEVIALDGIEVLPKRSPPRIRGHGLHGLLPEITLRVDLTDRRGALNRLGREAVKLRTVSQLRREVSETFSGPTLLPPTTLDGKYVAGLQWDGRTVQAEAVDFDAGVGSPCHESNHEVGFTAQRYTLASASTA